MPNSTTRRRRKKPCKPRPDFPLFIHATGRWCKKIRQRFHYFGKVTDSGDFGAADALAAYQAVAEPLHAGRVPRPEAEGLTVESLINRFLAAKERAMEAGELTPRVFRDYKPVCKRVYKAFGARRLVSDLQPEDFARLNSIMARTMAPVTRKTEIQRTRCLFNYASQNRLIDRPVEFGSEFKPPGKKVLARERAKARQKNGKRMFSVEELRAMLDAAPTQFKAMAMLGINCGFGNSDVATLPITALDLEAGWVEHARPKTGEPRRNPLWLETVEVLRESLVIRPEPKDPENGHLAFITRAGNPWVRLAGAGWTDNVTVATRGILIRLGLKRPGLNFYCLRRGFETIGGESRDQVAVNSLMGHSDDSMAAQYREGISDDRLIAVSDHVHGWLFNSDETK